MQTILIVDDLEIERLTLRRILERNGMKVLEACDGAQGLQMAKTHRPNLILMDVVMPESNGFQTLRAIKRDSDIKGIPVVMVTTKDREPDRMNAEDNGASGYVVKPANESTLMTQIQQALAA